MHSVTIDGETFYLRRFTFGEYRSANIDPDDSQATMDAMISMSLANEDGSRRFATTSEGVDFTNSLPFSVAMKLVSEITEVNGLGEKKA